MRKCIAFHKREKNIGVNNIVATFEKFAEILKQYCKALKKEAFLMKKVMAIILIVVMTLLATPSLAEFELGCWTREYYVDEFDDPTDEWFLLHNEIMFLGDVKTVGLAQMFVSGGIIGFRLFENFDITTGSSTPVVNSSSFEKKYTISFKDSSGKKYSYTGTAPSGEARIYLSRPAVDNSVEIRNAIYDILIDGGDIQVVISSTDDQTKYKFTLEGNSSFVEVYPFSTICNFQEGLAEVRRYYKKSGFIDKKGNLVVPCEWDDARYFREGLAAVKKDDKWGFIDKAGNLVVPCVWDDIYFLDDKSTGFREGLAPVKKGDKWGFIDKTGNLVIPCEWDYVRYFYEGFARVRKNDKEGLIDKTGNLVIPCEWDKVYPFDGGDVAPVEKDGKWGFVDKTGNLVIPCEFDYMSGFHDGLRMVQKAGEKGFVDKTGNLVIHSGWSDVFHSGWSDAFDFSDGLARVKYLDKCGFIDKTGNLVIPCEWKYANDFEEGLATVWSENHKVGFIDKTGKLVVPCEWDYAYSFSEGFVRVNKGNKWGFVDKTGKLVVPCEWDDVNDFHEGLAVVRKGETYLCIDSEGNVVIK